MSRSARDDGAPSFRAEGALKVRAGRRPTSLIPAGFCHLVQEDKWTFDTNTRPILLKTKMFALFIPRMAGVAVGGMRPVQGGSGRFDGA